MTRSGMPAASPTTPSASEPTATQRQGNGFFSATGAVPPGGVGSALAAGAGSAAFGGGGAGSAAFDGGGAAGAVRAVIARRPAARAAASSASLTVQISQVSSVRPTSLPAAS